jgi:superfamily I DNA/RNA helicase
VAEPFRVLSGEESIIANRFVRAARRLDLRIINTPRREIGPSTLQKLGTYASERQVSMLAACD